VRKTAHPKIRALTEKLDATDVKRAIYVDYEGNIRQPPTLLGWRIDKVHFGAIVEPLFATCANRYRARGNWLHDHAALVQRLITRAEQEQRRIVSWSEHDWRQMCAVLDRNWRSRLQKVYRNAIKTARPWYWRRHQRTPPEASLEHFLEEIGQPHPQRYGPGLVEESLKLIRRELNEVGNYAKLTDLARSRWVAVVKHNQLDLKGMEAVMRKVTTSKEN
jgi:hypothetical protein